MGVFDVEELLKAVGPDNAVGDDLEYDPGFIAMETLASPGGDQSMIAGAGEADDQTTDWKGVREKALALLQRSKDLRVAVYLVRSALACDGLAGFADTLLLLRGLLEQHWNQVHPQLDPDDDNDPTMRMNTIAMLSGKPETLDLLVAVPLVTSAKLGSFCFRDIQVASGQVAPASGQSEVTTALIAAACLDCELEALQATCSLLGESLGQVHAIGASLTELVGASQAPDLEPLEKLLKSMHKYVSEQLANRGVSCQQTDAVGGSDTGASPVSAVESSPAGEILSRADAMAMMDKISDYFVSHEPSSPIPLLMQRAKRLSSMDFLGIVKDLAPGGLSQAETLAGTPVSGKGGGTQE